MWKRIILVILVLIVLAYSALWFHHAGETEAKMTQMLADIGGKEGAPATGVKVTYQDISVSGYPTEFVTHVVNPVITVDSAIFMQNLMAARGQVPTAPQAGNSPTDVIKLHGDIRLSVNYFTNSIGLRFTGDSEGESHASGKKFSWKTKQNGLAGCTISMSRDADMSIFKNNAFSPLENPEQLFNTFRSIDCLADPMEVTEKETGEMLYRGGDQIFSVDMDKLSENGVSVQAVVTSRDMEVSDRWKSWVEQIKHSINPQGLQMGVLPISSYEAIGKQNIEFKMNYRGPMHFDNLENAEIKLDIPTFSASNNLYTLSFPLEANISMKSGQTTGDVSLKGETVYSEKIDAYAQKSIEQMVETIYTADPQGIENQFAAITSRIGQEEMVKRIQGVIPALGELKKFHTNLDLSFKGNKGQSAMDVTGESSIRSLDLRAGDYGFSATGSGAFPPPRGELSIRCHSCNDTVDKLVLYATNVQKLVSLMNPSIPSIPDSIAFRTAAAGFINNLSVPVEDTPKDRLIQISDSGNGQMVISGKTTQDVSMLAMQTFMPFFTPQQPTGGLE